LSVDFEMASGLRRGQQSVCKTLTQTLFSHTRGEIGDCAEYFLGGIEYPEAMEKKRDQFGGIK